MASSKLRILHTVCKRYGPGRLPNADRHDIGAGYAAASAAVVATVLYGAVIGIDEALRAGMEGAANLLLASVALPIVVPAAFLVGVAGWRLLPSYTSATGIVAGGLGAIATYLVSLVLLGVLLTVAAGLSLTGAGVVDAAAFSVGLVAVAFALTWWVTVPVGCLSGLIYVNVTDPAN